MRFVWIILAAAPWAVTACGEPRATAEEPAASASTATSAVPVSDGVDRSAPELPPNIYYDLTRYEWYAQGRPLIHDGQSYQPDGMPVAIELANLSRVGDYEGVDYYTPKAPDPDGLIYVPVFEGYWLPFGPMAPVGLPAND